MAGRDFLREPQSGAAAGSGVYFGALFVLIIQNVHSWGKRFPSMYISFSIQPDPHPAIYPLKNVFKNCDTFC